MRSKMKSLGHKEWTHLPLWMRTSQDGSGVPLGYKMAIVLAYCNPGESGKVRKRILDNGNESVRDLQNLLDYFEFNLKNKETAIVYKKAKGNE